MHLHWARKQLARGAFQLGTASHCEVVTNVEHFNIHLVNLYKQGEPSTSIMRSKSGNGTTKDYILEAFSNLAGRQQANACMIWLKLQAQESKHYCFGMVFLYGSTYTLILPSGVVPPNQTKESEVCELLGMESGTSSGTPVLKGFLYRIYKEKGVLELVPFPKSSRTSLSSYQGRRWPTVWVWLGQSSGFRVFRCCFAPPSGRDIQDHF